jgi:hypothetical protein
MKRRRYDGESVSARAVIVGMLHRDRGIVSFGLVCCIGRRDFADEIANREKILIEGAKKEGKVMFYTGLIVDQVVRPVKDAFEKEYPLIQVDFFRVNAERLAQRMLAEYQSKRYEVDLVSGSSAATILQRAGMMQRF